MHSSFSWRRSFGKLEQTVPEFHTTSQFSKPTPCAHCWKLWWSLQSWPIAVVGIPDSAQWWSAGQRSAPRTICHIWSQLALPWASRPPQLVAVGEGWYWTPYPGLRGVSIFASSCSQSGCFSWGAWQWYLSAYLLGLCQHRLRRSVISLTRCYPPCLSISADTMSNPSALLFFKYFIATMVSAVVIALILAATSGLGSQRFRLQ